MKHQDLRRFVVLLEDGFTETCRIELRKTLKELPLNHAYWNTLAQALNWLDLGNDTHAWVVLQTRFEQQ